MEFNDEFRPRPFQRDVIDRVTEGIAAGRRETIVLASPGSGKTLAYQALGTTLFRHREIDHIAVFVPRVALAQQCELGWMTFENGKPKGACESFQTPRLGKIRHRVNETPLTPPSEPGSGFASTYSALATNPEIFRHWALRHRGRFLLVADEAQFCGDANDNDSGGTVAGKLIEELHQYALHTLLLTGTPYRADNKSLVLAKYTDLEPGQRHRQLIHHAEASYADGIAEEYLRPFEMQLTDAKVTQTTLGDPENQMAGESTLTYNLSDDGSDLREVLRREETWKPLVDRVVTGVRSKKKFNPAYRGLISCMQQEEARKVKKYLEAKYSDLRVGIAVSSDTDAPKALSDFKFTNMDILVTVRMAFIGYDCPQITVVGILTNYRDGGHLTQLVGRGLRVWDKMPVREQTCLIIAPDDPRMKDFLGLLRQENEEGLRVLKERDEVEREKTGTETQPPLAFISGAVATTTRAASNDTDLSHVDLKWIEDIKVTVDSGEDATKGSSMNKLTWGVATAVARSLGGV